MKKIDAHAHVGDFGGWAGVSITAQQLVEQMDAYEMEKAVLCSSDSTDNDLAAQAARTYPGRFWPLVYTNPLEGKKAVEQIYRYVEEEGFCGIKLQPLKHAYVADSAVVDPVMEAAEKLRVPVFIHCGHPPYSLPWSIAFLAERHAQVPTVMIHMGHGHGVYIDAALKMARRFPNLYLEMSGMPMGSKIKEAYETVGKERILFGTDAPFHHPSVEIQKVLTCGLEEAALADVFYENAYRLMTR